MENYYIKKLEDDFDEFEKEAVKGCKKVEKYVKKWNEIAKKGRKEEKKITLMELLKRLEDQSGDDSEKYAIKRIKTELLMDLGIRLSEALIEYVLLFDLEEMKGKIQFVKNTIPCLKVEKDSIIVIQRITSVLEVIRTTMESSIESFSKIFKGKRSMSNDDITTDESFREKVNGVECNIFFIVFYLEAALSSPIFLMETTIVELSNFIFDLKRSFRKRVTKIRSEIDDVNMEFISASEDYVPTKMIKTLKEMMQIFIEEEWKILVDLNAAAQPDE